MDAQETAGAVRSAARQWWDDHVLDETRDRVGAAYDGFIAGAQWAAQHHPVDDEPIDEPASEARAVTEKYERWWSEQERQWLQIPRDIIDAIRAETLADYTHPAPDPDVLADALTRIAYEERTAHLACSDLPFCSGESAEGHAADCAVGIARAALASAQAPAGGVRTAAAAEDAIVTEPTDMERPVLTPEERAHESALIAAAPTPSHALVEAALREAYEKSQHAGMCYVCGREGEPFGVVHDPVCWIPNAERALAALPAEPAGPVAREWRGKWLDNPWIDVQEHALSGHRQAGFTIEYRDCGPWLPAEGEQA